jgi:hypothetical protein
MTVNTRIIKLILSRIDLPYIKIQHGKRLQIIPDFNALPFCQKSQSAAFIASHQMLLVWEDDPMRLLTRTQEIQDALMKVIWGDEIANDTATSAEKSSGVKVTECEPAAHNGNKGPRRTVMWQSAYTAMAICMLTTATASGWRQIAIQQIQEPNWLRLLFIIALPGQIWLSLVRHMDDRIGCWIC